MQSIVSIKNKDWRNKFNYIDIGDNFLNDKNKYNNINNKQIDKNDKAFNSFKDFAIKNNYIKDINNI